MSDILAIKSVVKEDDENLHQELEEQSTHCLEIKTGSCLYCVGKLYVQWYTLQYMLLQYTHSVTVQLQADTLRFRQGVWGVIRGVSPPECCIPPRKFHFC